MIYYNGMQVIYSESALKETDERKFPFSRHRSNRINKKLIKRFGGEFVMIPCAYAFDNTLIVHPAWKKELENHVNTTNYI